jgi:SAM-dependent methyltransferase
MRTPWLDIPLTDYERHMALPQVGQAQLVADQLAALVANHRPSSVAIVGCAGGNGFERLGSAGVERIVGLDINPRYIEAARKRFATSLPALELITADIQSSARLFEAVDFIYAALLFEYVDPMRAMISLRRHCRTGGVLATVIQLPHESLGAVSPSPYVSLQALASTLRLVAAEELRVHAEQAGFRQTACSRLVSPGGKEFALQTFEA